MLRNFIYTKKNLDRPQCQLSVYWLKFNLKDFLENFNIIPCGDDSKRQFVFVKMIETINSFKNLYKKWSIKEIERRKKYCDKKDLIQFKYNLIVNDYRIISLYVLAIWLTRNILKYSKELVDAFNIFRNIFNKWFLIKTSI